MTFTIQEMEESRRRRLKAHLKEAAAQLKPVSESSVTRNPDVHSPRHLGFRTKETASIPLVHWQEPVGLRQMPCVIFYKLEVGKPTA
jgi:hypothetical protein